MAKNKYSKDFFLQHGVSGHGTYRYVSPWFILGYLNGKTAWNPCRETFCRIFKIPLKLITGRKHRVRITIEFLKEIK